MPRGLLMIGGVAIYGVLVVIFSFSPWFSLSMGLMAIIGICHVSSHALVQTVIQTYSPSKFRGRTMAIFQLSNVVMTCGSMMLGSLATALGTQWAVGLMGAAGALMVVFIHVTMPRAWRIR